MEAKIESIKGFIEFIFQLFKTDIKVSIAKSILGAGVLMASGGPTYNLFFMKDDIAMQLQVDNTGYILLIVGLILIGIAIMMLIRFYNSVSIHPYLYFSPSLQNMNTEIPIYAVDKRDKYTTRPQYIGTINSYDKSIVISNYNFLQTSFEKRFDHADSNKIYMAVIGSFPFMFLMGTLLRNGHIKSHIMDYSNEKQEWFSLFPGGLPAHHEIMNTDKNIDDEIDSLSHNDSNDIGIALSYSYEVFKNTLPEELQENTLFLKNSLGIEPYLLNYEKTQQALITEIFQYIHKLRQNGKRIHLFVSAQASFCVNLGKRYQNNVTGTLVLHNYNAQQKKYNWNIQFDKGDVE